MVSAGSNTCNVLPRREEIKFILLLFRTGGSVAGREEETREIKGLEVRRSYSHVTGYTR